ncbi:hypothetical protein FOPG_17415 [Fusarium oxysporum f. sp. conglutinans race 2 54008]|uniref:Uncharacterized protein n=3 Tax=Fusarium oxysporum f. sp. conglutinans TaxID=100902 RepID=A0A8H6G948_FUSOX|nr:hypothetical protein FOXB_02685 [Fusarium oxysporum f. sp. conglutinans Fo5176]EXL66406.1 hypothetical protein FOPG_17415 [Fusarium oxysporum f. sp. conglutinans race 2 54008]KAF6513698.1 hypothetical protein HZS61_007023 [Fusarium oxysporum f. sp. conglutinans]KAI8398628.1 hypothetical protein FOFC_19843 [Fusarium oxysporum]
MADAGGGKSGHDSYDGVVQEASVGITSNHGQVISSGNTAKKRRDDAKKRREEQARKEAEEKAKEAK